MTKNFKEVFEMKFVVKRTATIYSPAIVLLFTVKRENEKPLNVEILSKNYFPSIDEQHIDEIFEKFIKTFQENHPEYKISRYSFPGSIAVEINIPKSPELKRQIKQATSAMIKTYEVFFKTLKEIDDERKIKDWLKTYMEFEIEI